MSMVVAIRSPAVAPPKSAPSGAWRHGQNADVTRLALIALNVVVKTMTRRPLLSPYEYRRNSSEHATDIARCFASVRGDSTNAVHIALMALSPCAAIRPRPSKSRAPPSRPHSSTAQRKPHEEDSRM